MTLPPPPIPTPLRPGLVLVRLCLLVLFACRLCLSICQYISPDSVLAVHKPSHSTLILMLIRASGTKQPDPGPAPRPPLRWRMLSRQTDCVWLVFWARPRHCLHSQSDWVTTAYPEYAHVANASLCFGLCPTLTFRVLLNGCKRSSDWKWSP